MGAEYKGPHFIGILESLGRTSEESTDFNPSYTYCLSRFRWEEKRTFKGFKTPEEMGVAVAQFFGKYFRQQITYDLPHQKNWYQDSINPIILHEMSVLEREKFEGAVLKALEGQE